MRAVAIASESTEPPNNKPHRPSPMTHDPYAAQPALEVCYVDTDPFECVYLALL